MEQGRLFIAIALSFLIFFLWDFFFVDKKETQKTNQQTQITEQVQPGIPKTEDISSPIAARESSKGAMVAPQVLRPSRILTVNTPLYHAKIDTQGAVVKSFALQEYRQRVEADAPLLEMVSDELAAGTMKVEMRKNSIAELENAVFQASVEENVIDIRQQPRTISFSWTSPQGVSIEKHFGFSPTSYNIEFTIRVSNGSDFPIQDQLVLALAKKSGEGTVRYGFQGPSALIDNKLEQIKTKKIKEQNIFPGKISWIAVQDRYFMSSIIPQEIIDGEMILSLKENDVLESRLAVGFESIHPGGQKEFQFNIFFGPKSMSVLKRIGHNLDKAVNFGMFDFIAKPCLWLMNKLYTVIPNYGIAIIVLTLLTKILLWPLGNKSYKSMAAMKKLQPLMAEIREKNKNDKRKMNEEVMGLYKTYKVNPMGGCLPMVVQIPVFFALYRMLYEAIELRHAPFFGWITDLSAPDRLFHFSMAIPFMQAPYGIPVLTIIMGGTMFLQQKMQPPMGDAAQAKMMMLMPVVFTVIFINFSSGLVLYWLINNILSISQQHYINKKSA